MLRSVRPYLPRTKLSVSITATAFVALTVLAVSAHSWLAPAAMNEPPVSAAAQALPAAAPLEAELIVIRPSGFEPSQITRPAGRFILAVENRSGLDEVDLRLDRDDGDRLQQVRVPRSKLDWSGVVDPPPGTYVLTEANHSDWSCRITITAR